MSDESGIYMIRRHDGSESYIGKSWFIADRLEQHQTAIVKRRGTEKFLKAFPDMSVVEFRVLEVIETPDDRATIDEQIAANNLIADRERHWISTLNPTLNINLRRRKIIASDLPHGPPPPRAEQA